MMKNLESPVLLLARILMPLLFIVSGYGKITNYAGTEQYMASAGVPGFLLPLTILLELGGGLATLAGFMTRTTALFTAGFSLIAALIFHHNFTEGMHSTLFLKDFSIAGGYLLLALYGPGKYSVDHWLNRKW